MDHFLTGIIGVFVLAAILTLIVAWIVFPFIVLSKFNELLKEMKNISAQNIQAASQRAEIARAMQWIVDNLPPTDR